MNASRFARLLVDYCLEVEPGQQVQVSSTTLAEPLVRQKELLGRYRFASADERRWIRDALREHLAEHFPDVEGP